LRASKIKTYISKSELDAICIETDKFFIYLKIEDIPELIKSVSEYYPISEQQLKDFEKNSSLSKHRREYELERIENALEELAKTKNYLLEIL